MELRYGQILQLKKNIDISFYCDGILPAGQMGYQETHYKIKFHQATIILPQSLICELFEEYKIENTDTITENEDKESSLDLTKLKKAELIDILEGQTHE